MIPQRSKDLVFGFVKEIGKSLETDTMIPNEIVSICLSYAWNKQFTETRRTLNKLLDHQFRPSIIQISAQGLIPENWLLDLYGLSDDVRKRHIHHRSDDVEWLTRSLYIPPVLADVVARDVLDEIEAIDPYLLKQCDVEIINNNKTRDSVDEDDH